MNLNTELNFNLNFKKHNPMLAVASGLIVLNTSILLLVVSMVIGFFLSVNRPETPDQASGLLNQPAIQKAALLLKERTIQFVTPQ